MTKTRAPMNARQTALHVLYAIDAQQAYTDMALRQALQHSTLEQRDRAFVTECVYGVVRWQGRIDWLLGHACHRPLDTLTPWMRNALRLGAYQCLWMRVPHRAAVHATVELARHFGHAGVVRLVNGVLRALLRDHTTYQVPDAVSDPVGYLTITTSHPAWLLERWLQRYGWERTQALCAANNRPVGITLRTNTLRTTPEALAERLQAEGLRQVTPSHIVPAGLVVQGSSRLDALASYSAGWFQVQDEGAMLVAPLCQAQPGERLLDVCAAPGGKATHLAQLMQDHGQIIVCDIQPGRLRLLQANVRRLGLHSILAVAADAAAACPWQGTFAAILVDAPCSGFGVLRRHPDIKWRKSAADLHDLQAIQLALLHAQQKRLADHGRLVYSVCSNEPEETHEVVRSFLAHHPHMRLDAVDNDTPQRPVQPSPTVGTLDLTPEQWGTEGVFVARFRLRDSQP